MKYSRTLDAPDLELFTQDVKLNNPLSYTCDVFCGIITGDNDRFVRKYWELIKVSEKWEYYQRTTNSSIHYGGMEQAIFWENGLGVMSSLPSFRGLNPDLDSALNKRKIGFVIHRMGKLPCTIAIARLFDQNGAVLVPKNPEDAPAIWDFISSKEYCAAVRTFDNKTGVTPKTLAKPSFNKDKFPIFDNCIPKPYSDDPTQWIFHGHPCGSVMWDDEKKWTAIGPLRTDATVLQVAVVRLLGYRWPAELNNAMELSDEARTWVKQSQELVLFADEDGIVCIPAVRGEMKAEDRLENLLAVAYGSEWSSNKKAELLAQAGHAGKTVETWLRDKFFTQHCKLFHHRPFIWHIWDGLRDGFAALVNYHKFDHKLLKTLIYTYLGDWISRQKQDIGNGVDGAQEKLAATESLKKKLELILEGETPYDIFVRWKPIEKQPFGWNPDLNDGVSLNIRPFMTVGDVKKRGAGVLRDKPNIKWTKDRGKDVPSAPWYHLGPIYGGNEGGPYQ